jgi:flagella basal body P-ring formation protein FlgA
MRPYIIIAVPVLVLIALLSTISSAFAQPPAAARIHLILKSSVIVHDEFVTAGDVFENSPPDYVASLKLIPSPRFGGEVRLSSSAVLRQLLSKAPLHYKLDGAKSVRITRSGRDRRAEVEGLVRDGVERHFRNQAGTECQVSFPQSALFLPEGRLNVDLTLPDKEIGSDILNCRIRVNDTVIKKMNIACRVVRRLIVPVATRLLSRGDTLRAGDMEWIEKTTDKRIRPSFAKSDRPEGYRLKRSVQPGRIIHQDAVDKHPDIFRGQIVKLVVQKKNIRVTAKASALEEGWIGSRIRVKNLINNNYIHARVVGKGVVIYE